MAETDTEKQQTQSSAPVDSYATRKEEFSLVRGKYRVYFGSPMSLMDMPNAKAYQAEEIAAPDHKIFALVCNPDLPIRKDHLKVRNGVKIDGLLPLVDAGVAFWPPIGRKTMFLLYEMPLGGRVLISKTYGKVLPEEESEKISKWIRPLLGGIGNLAVRGLTHRAIRPDNLFYMDPEKTKVVWGDCISAPPGYDQPPVFETIEASMCQKEGKGNGTTADDLYAFGATLLCLSIGYNPIEKLSPAELLEQKIYKGSYATLIGEERVPLALIELFRGLLADNTSQRWDTSSTTLWADGRRLTPVQAKAAKASQRPFMFNNVEYFSYRALAYAFSKNWDMAIEAIRSEKFLNWIERGFDDKETVNAIRKSMDMALVHFSTREKQDDFFVARTCMILDPLAPLRMRNYSFMPDSLGTMLATSITDDKKTKMLIGLIATGYLESWYEFHRDMTAEQSIKNLQTILQKPGKGMGIERVLYELNEGLPCQSPLIVKDYVDEVRDLLPALEEVAKKNIKNAEPIDRHVAAFIAVKFGLKASEYIAYLNSPKESAVVQGILHLFMTLQKTFGPEHLHALTSWVGSMVAPVIDSYHNLEKRQQLEKNLPKIIRKGSFAELCSFLDDKQERLYDISYFEQAKKEYAKLSEEIDFLDGNREKREEEGLMLGNQVAAIISFGIALLTMFLLLLARLLRG